MSDFTLDDVDLREEIAQRLWHRARTGGTATCVPSWTEQDGYAKRYWQEMADIALTAVHISELLAVAQAAERLVGATGWCMSPLVDPEADEILGDCGRCAACKLSNALANLHAATKGEKP